MLGACHVIACGEPCCVVSLRFVTLNDTETSVSSIQNPSNVTTMEPFWIFCCHIRYRAVQRDEPQTHYYAFSLLTVQWTYHNSWAGYPEKAGLELFNLLYITMIFVAFSCLFHEWQTTFIVVKLRKKPSSSWVFFTSIYFHNFIRFPSEEIIFYKVIGPCRYFW